ncbi:MAG: T9SS type A sorting domain-containing protein [Bacteroidetes bacterium]|nr:T9SS type A sorting domain-containing protein [Bacteroidota bacterium]
MKQKKITQKVFLLLLALIGFIGMKAQTAGATCATAVSLADGYSPSASLNTNTEGHFKFIPGKASETFTLTNSNNDVNYRISRVDIYSGTCSGLTSIGTDVLSGSTDSILSVPLVGLSVGQTYYIKLTRILNTTQTTNFSTSLISLICGVGYFYHYDPNFSSYPNNNVNGICLDAAFGGTVSACNLTICCQNTFAIVNGDYNAGANTPVFIGNGGPYYYVVYASGGNPTYTIVNTTTNLTVTPIPFPYPSGTTYTINMWDNTTYPNPANQPVGTVGCFNLVVTSLCEVPGGFTINSPICAGTQACFTYTTIPANAYYQNVLISYTNTPVTASLQPVNFTNGYTWGSCQTYTAAGTYTAQYITQYGIGTQKRCASTTTFVTVVLPASGTISAVASPSFVCSGQNSTLTASATGVTSYTWFSGTSTLTGNPIVVSPTVNTTYTVIGGSCPQRTAYVTVQAGDCCVNPGVGNISFNNITLVPFGTGGATAWTSLVANGLYTGISIAIPSSGIISGNYSVNGFLTLTAPNTTFSNTQIYFGENAVFNHNATATIDMSYWHGCNKNWQGIVSTRLLTIKNFVIEDASGAITINATSLTHPGLNVDNTIFNKNVYGMIITGPKVTSYKLTGSIFTSRDIPVANYVYTSGSRWTSLANFSNASLAAYNPGYLKGSTVMSLPATARGQVGIYFGGASLLITGGNPAGNITIGDASTTPTLNTSYTNVFDYLRIGEYNSNSRLISYNNYFQWISSIPTSDLYGNSTACVYNNSTPRAVIGSNATGTGLNIYTNNFNNSTNGVYATNNGTLQAYNNQFTSITQYGVQVESWNCTNTQTVQILNNNFNTCLYDLYAFNNNTIKLNFANNISTYPFVAVKAKVTYHAYISEISSPATAKYYIGYSNSVGKVNGVYCINTYSPAVVNNTITIRTPIGAGFNANIWLDNTHQGDIKFNTLSVNPTNLSSYNTFGIFTNVGNNNLFCENYITGAGSCMKFQGTSPSRIYRNNLNSVPTASCLFGIFLDNSGSIGPIKYNTSCADNIFGEFISPPTGSDTRAQNNSSGSQIDYSGAYSSSNQYCPFNNTVPGFPDLSTSFTPFSNSSTGVAVCIAQPVGAQLVQQSSSSASSPTLSAGVPIIMNSANNFSSNDLLMKKIANKSTFELAKKSAINTSAITGGTSFMNTNANNAIGSFYKMDSLVGLFAVNNNTATLNQAKNLNTALVPVGVIETNQKTFNTVYHLFMKNENLITASHITTLKNLAALCPFTDGTSVYQARALVKHFDTTEFINSCENNPVITSSGNRLINTTELNQTKEALSTLVYPNPAGNEITISTDVEGAKLLIFNIMGQVILESDLTTLTKVNVDELKNGTYIYKIVKDAKIIKADKLIISK